MVRSRWFSVSLRSAGLVLTLAFAVAGSVAGQEKKEKVAGQEKKGKPTIPKPETVPLQAKDGFTVAATFYPGGFLQKSEKEITTKPLKEVVPVILLHGFEGNRREMEPLALTLQRQGHAVLSIDLRGHGDSRIKVANGGEIEPSKLRPAHFAAMEADVEAGKAFLLKKNNEGSLNLEMLCVLGCELGGLVATNWVAYDWSRPDLPAFKQGKYAKALIVVSPVASVKGYSATNTWRHSIYHTPGFSIMLVAGKGDSKSSTEAAQIHNRLDKSHPLPTEEKERLARQSLFLIEPDTNLSGARLLDPRARLQSVTNSISQFITLRLANRKGDFPWTERKNPLAGN